MIDTDGDCAEWYFPAEANAVRTARHAVRETLRAWELDAALGDVTVLLVSELVTNSLRYASGPIGVRLVRPRLDGAEPSPHPALLVEVSDPLPDPPTERPAGPEDEGAADSVWWPVPHGAGGPVKEGRAKPYGSSWLSLVSKQGGTTITCTRFEANETTL